MSYPFVIPCCKCIDFLFPSISGLVQIGEFARDEWITICFKKFPPGFNGGATVNNLEAATVRVWGFVSFYFGFPCCVLFPPPGVAGQCSTIPSLQWRPTWFTFAGNRPPHKTLVFNPPLRQMIPVYPYVHCCVSLSPTPVWKLPPLRSSPDSPWSAGWQLLLQVCERLDFLYNSVSFMVH